MRLEGHFGLGKTIAALFLIALSALLVACNSNASNNPLPLTTKLDRIRAKIAAESGEQDTSKNLSPKEKWQCLIDGGDEDSGAISSDIFCSRPTVDAGKKCKISEDCEAYRLAETKTCSAITPPSSGVLRLHR